MNVVSASECCTIKGSIGFLWLFGCVANKSYQIYQCSSLYFGETTGLNQGILFFDSSESTNAYFSVLEDVRILLMQSCDPEQARNFRIGIDKFYETWMIQLASESGLPIPDLQDIDIQKNFRNFLLGPDGFIYTLAHIPQNQSLHNFIIHIAVVWQENLFQIGEYNDAANVINAICFSLARQGYRQQAISLLDRISHVTSGTTNLIARANLATLLREDEKPKSALKIYNQLLWGLLRHRAYKQLAMVLSEMGVSYRQLGQTYKAIFTLQACVVLHKLLKNDKSRAIAYSQLASSFRYRRLLLPALLYSKKAVSLFQTSSDLLNLGRSLLTQGNIYQNMKNARKAHECFDASLELGRRIKDPQAICGSLSGKARAYFITKDFQPAHDLLKEAISLRERNSDHKIGIEYENMGVLYELQGNYGTALAWYRKALTSFEKYMPLEASACKYKINRLERWYSKKQNLYK